MREWFLESKSYVSGTEDWYHSFVFGRGVGRAGWCFPVKTYLSHKRVGKVLSKVQCKQKNFFILWMNYVYNVRDCELSFKNSCFAEFQGSRLKLSGVPFRNLNFFLRLRKSRACRRDISLAVSQSLNHSTLPMWESQSSSQSISSTCWEYIKS